MIIVIIIIVIVIIMVMIRLKLSHLKGSGRKFQSSFYEGSELDNCDDNNNK